MQLHKKHPLLQENPTALDSWRNWLKAWNSTTLTEVRHSLLHFGLDVPNSDSEYLQTERGYEKVKRERYSDRVLFYLAVANGWTEFRNFASSDEWARDDRRQPPGLIYLRESERRQKLAAKAFAMLFSDLFAPYDEERAKKDYDYRNGEHLYWKRLENREIVALLRFFRVTRRNRWYDTDQITNMPSRMCDEAYGNYVEVRSHLLEKVERFLVEFITFLWKEYEPKQDSYYFRDREKPTAEELERKAAVEAYNLAQQKFANSLVKHRYVLARLLIELGHADKVWRLPMDERTPQALRRFAMRAKTEVAFHRGDGSIATRTRRVNSLAEVITYCKDTRVEVARFLLICEAKERARKAKEAEDAPEIRAAHKRRKEMAEESRLAAAAKLRAEADKLEGKKK